MLSYFLGGGGGADVAMPADFTTTHSSQNGHDHNNNNSGGNGVFNNQQHHNSGDLNQKPVGKGAKTTTMESKDEEEDEEDDSFMPPPTPLAPQFYRKNEKPSNSENGSKSSGGSDASMRTMTHTLVSGGPFMQSRLAPAQSSNSLGSLSPHQSPLSPALMLSNHAENMLLPPENITTHQQHLLWLQELNSRAVAAQQAQMAVASFPPQVQSSAPRQQQHQQNQQQPQQHLFGHPGAFPVPVPSNTTAYLSATGWMQPQDAAPPLAATMPAVVAAALAPIESEEKRAKRLERNRESARKSRRKKKERLESLEAAVQLLQSKIAAERLVQMAGMVGGLQGKRRAMRLEFDTSEAPRIAMRESGPQSSIFQGVSDFHYTALKLDLLPPYQKFWLWISRQPEQFFLTGKQIYIQKRENVSMARISSKQVGEELSKESSGPPLHVEDENAIVPKHTSYAYHASRFWPMVCYEHQFSVDQEERFLALHKRYANDELPWSQAVGSVQAVSSLSSAMTSVCGMASQREERTWVGILRPDQASAFQLWLTPGRLETLRPPGLVPSPEDSSLSDICKRLQQVAISKASDR